MPTRQDCIQGMHTTDNQGLCWWCAKVVDVYLYEQYLGEAKPDQPEEPKPEKPPDLWCCGW